MENAAEFADSSTAGKALNTIAQAANEKDMRQCEPLNSMLLISSALAFAQYDDKRIWAYDVIENAITRNLEYSFNEESEESDEDDEDEDNEDTSEVDDETDFIPDESLHVLQLFTLMSAYDLYALSNDDAGREQLLKDYPESMALTLMNAANMIHEGHLRSAYMLAQDFLLSSRIWKMSISMPGITVCCQTCCPMDGIPSWNAAPRDSMTLAYSPTCIGTTFFPATTDPIPIT